MTKIIFYSPSFFTGGMENAVYHLIRLLSKRGEYEFMIVYDHSVSATMEKRYLEFAKVEHRTNKYIKCDVLVNCSPMQFNLENIHARKRINWVHSAFVKNTDNVSNLTNFIVQSEWQKKQLAKYKVMNPRVIRNVLDFDYIRKKALENHNFDYKRKENEKIFLMVCRISPEKGLVRAIEFMKRKCNLNNRLVIVGGVILDQNESITKLLRKELGDRVSFEGDSENPYPYMRECDYLCSFSDSETYGLVTEEAHILGKPIVFNHYETAFMQFLPNVDEWIDRFDENTTTQPFVYTEKHIENSLKEWEELFPITKSSDKLDFYASKTHYFTHMLPIWNNLPQEYRGNFYIDDSCVQIAKSSNVNTIVNKPNDNLTLVASYQDYQETKGEVILMEHGIGHTYSNNHPAYAGGYSRDRVVLFLCQNELVYNKNKATYPNKDCVIVGTPKMDKVFHKPTNNEIPIVCIAFHWDCMVSAETRSAFEQFKRTIPVMALNKRFKLVMHGHPRQESQFAEFAKKSNVEYWYDFNDVLEKADVYINDNSSTMYEFCLTGRNLIVLNAPSYRKNINHGLRFWDYVPGKQVDYWQYLEKEVEHCLDNPTEWSERVSNIAKALYPYHGSSTERATSEIVAFMERWK